MLGSHIIRYGVGYNRLRGGGLFSFSAISPNVSPIGNIAEVNVPARIRRRIRHLDVGQTIFLLARREIPARRWCPLNYPVDNVTLGNGQGCDTEIPAFNAPCSGTPPDNRIGLYLGDSWKLRPNLNVTYGVRYVRDTGRPIAIFPASRAIRRLTQRRAARLSQSSKAAESQFRAATGNCLGSAQ